MKGLGPIPQGVAAGKNAAWQHFWRTFLCTLYPFTFIQHILLYTYTKVHECVWGVGGWGRDRIRGVAGEVGGRGEGGGLEGPNPVA